MIVFDDLYRTECYKLTPKYKALNSLLGFNIY